jgi:hypothetical protein
MRKPTDPIARAFELAQTGNYSSVDTVKNQLRLEGYSLRVFVGRTLNAQIKALISGSAVQHA